MNWIVDDVRMLSALLESAEELARSMGETEPGAEHLLLAALASPDDSARRALAPVEAPAVRDAIERVHATALASAGVESGQSVAVGGAPAGIYRSTGSAQRVVQRARELAKARRPRGLQSVDIVTAVAELPAGTATRALDALGVDRVALTSAL